MKLLIPSGIITHEYEINSRRDLRREAIKEYYDLIREYFVDLAGYNENFRDCGSPLQFATSRDAIRDIEQDLLDHYNQQTPPTLP